jgi:hypothetical protein
MRILTAKRGVLPCEYLANIVVSNQVRVSSLYVASCEYGILWVVSEYIVRE